MVYTLYIKSYCPSSQAAVKAAKATKEQCVVIDIEKYNMTTSKIVEKLKKHGFMKKSIKHNTVPIVFHEDKFIGGNRELQQLLSRMTV
jgi:glutaredoxin